LFEHAVYVVFHIVYADVSISGQVEDHIAKVCGTSGTSDLGCLQIRLRVSTRSEPTSVVDHLAHLELSIGGVLGSVHALAVGSSVDGAIVLHYGVSVALVLSVVPGTTQFTVFAGRLEPRTALHGDSSFRVDDALVGRLLTVVGQNGVVVAALAELARVLVDLFQSVEFVDVEDAFQVRSLTVPSTFYQRIAFMGISTDRTLCGVWFGA
jgi:hypothetical protein